MVKSREEVLRLIEQNQDTLRKLGVRRLGLFGSCVRDEATAESDLILWSSFQIRPSTSTWI